MSQDKGWLARAWTWVGHLRLMVWLVGAIVAVATNWTILTSLVFAIVTAVWAWAIQWGSFPVFLFTFGVFSTSIWLLNGLIWFYRQRRPSQQRISFDYSYGLALEQIYPALDLGNLENTLEMRLVIRNVANGPLRYEIDKFQFIVEDRFVNATIKTSVIPRLMSTTIFPGAGFKKDAYEQFQERTTGRLEYLIKYGHPEFPLSWKSEKTIELHLFKKADDQGNPGVNLVWIIANEKDEPL
jgi:hypothetical protein